MATDRGGIVGDGVALFVIVDAEPARRAQLDAAIRTVCDLGDLVRAGSPPWRVGRVVAGASMKEPLLSAVRRELASITPSYRVERAAPGADERRDAPRPDVALMVLIGAIGGPVEEPVLHGPSDGIALRELVAAVRACGAERHVMAVTGWRVGEVGLVGGTSAKEEAELTEGCLRALGSVGDLTLAAVGLGVLAQPTLENLFDAMAGRALDPSTGTVTLGSLASDVANAMPGVWLSGVSSGDSSSLFAPGGQVGLEGPDDLRLSRRPFPARPGAARPLIEEDLTGTVLPGQFRVDALFARGGFGAIYRARQLRVERDVAIKVLHAAVEPGSPSGRQFVHEIQSVGRIDHPNVVRIYQADLTAAGQLFFAMELLEGRDLEQVIEAEGAMEPPRAVALVGQLLAGLGAAHEVGLVHADIKPANALVVARRGDERLVLVDFGMSRLRAEGAARSVGGTPAYMAPEQLRDGKVDARSDLFSAALVLVTLVTGWRRRSREELAPPLELVADLQLRAVLGRALAIEASERFQSAAELAAALRAVPSGEPSGTGSSAPLGDHAVAEKALVPLSPAPEAPARSSRLLRWGTWVVAGSSLIVAGLAATWWVARALAPPTVLVGGSGTVLYGFFEPLRDFLEEQSGTTIPIDSKFDLGSGGAMRSLRAGELAIAALSARFDRQAPSELVAAGKLLLEVPIGFDETSLFVRSDNPLRRIDVAAIRAHLCCGIGEVTPQIAWSALGLIDAPLSDAPIAWTLFGRSAPPVPRDSTSSTLQLADAWLCEAKQLCAPTRSAEEAAAEEVLPKLMTGPEVLALSTRAFATSHVVPLEIFDGQHGTRLDGRKVLWLYVTASAGAPLPPHLCRLLAAALAPSVAERLRLVDKVLGLPEASRVRQRMALGLDDGSCSTRPLPLLAAADAGILRSPIADELEVAPRWVPEPAR
jgi:hypothetical protein